MQTLRTTAFDAGFATKSASHGGGLLGTLRRWMTYRETVQELNRLSQRQLKDIGVDGDVEGFAWRLTDR